MDDKLNFERLRELDACATPGDLSTAEYHDAEEIIECPICQGDGEVLAADYCNIDGKALGVQFYGIGSEFGAHEALWRYLRNAVPEILALLEADKDERVAALEAENARLREALERIALSGDGEDVFERSTLYGTFQNIARRALANKDLSS